MTVSKPGVMPVRVTEPETDPTAGFDTLHVPPVVASDNIKVCPTQTIVSGEVIVPALGSGFTVSSIFTVHPDFVYEMTTVPPDIPVTTPALLILPTDGVALVQEPPRDVSVSVSVLPAHNVVAELIIGPVPQLALPKI